jgi:hypothetical protein
VIAAAALLAGLGVAAWSSPGVADDSSGQQPAAGGAQPGSGQHGYKLKWLPYRPSVPSARSGAGATELGAQAVSKAPARTARRPHGEAFADPFADAAVSPGKPTLAATAGESRVPRRNPSNGKRPDQTLPEEPATQPTPEGNRPGFPSQKAIEVPAEPEREPSQAGGAAAGRQAESEEKCPSPYDPSYYTRIDELSSDTTAPEGQFPRECTLTEETFRPFAPGRVRQNSLGQAWAPSTFTWKASGLCTKPLYFEDVQLERYGHSWGPLLQPLASGANFFLSVPALPYKMGLYPPCECIYTLGYYRPGSCAPYMLDPFPLSIRAGLAEAGAWTGAVFAIP